MIYKKVTFCIEFERETDTIYCTLFVFFLQIKEDNKTKNFTINKCNFVRRSSNLFAFLLVVKTADSFDVD